MENFEPIQTMIGDITIERFCQVLGISFGIFTVSCFCVFFVFCFLNSFLNGRLHYKTKEYYGSFRYLNKQFKAIKKSVNVESVKIRYYELRSAIMLLKIQGVIPLFLYIRLIDKCQEVSTRRISEVIENEDN